MPTVVPKSAAIWGRSESVTRTCAWLANPATASSTIDRVGVLLSSFGASGAVRAVKEGTRGDAAVDRPKRHVLLSASCGGFGVPSSIAGVFFRRDIEFKAILALIERPLT